MKLSVFEMAKSFSKLVMFGLIVAQCFTAAAQSTSPNQSWRVRKTSLYELYFRQLTECEKLSRLANKDSLLKIQKNNLFDDCIETIRRKSSISPYYQSDLREYPYLSFDLHKSLYKINLLQWMKFFGCSDSTKLLKLNGGSFCKEELLKIDNLSKLGIAVDTFMLCRNQKAEKTSNLRNGITVIKSCKPKTPNKLNNLTPCDVLKKLSCLDSLRNGNFFNYIRFLSRLSGIEPNWDWLCPSTTYYSYDLTKSLYRCNLIQWSDFFNCKIDLPKLEQKPFSENEIDYIKTQKAIWIYVDTLRQ